MNIPPQYRAVEALEQHLGDPLDASRSSSFHQAVQNDDAEHYPDGFVGTLLDWGLRKHFVPAQEGGRLTSLEELSALSRALSRRDLTTAIAQGVSFLGSVPIWQAGTPAQRS